MYMFSWTLPAPGHGPETPGRPRQGPKLISGASERRKVTVSFREFTTAPNTYGPALPGLEFTRSTSELMKATKRWNLRLEPCLPSSCAPWLDPWTKRTPKEVSENDSALLSFSCLCPQQHKGDPTPTIKSIVFNGQTNVLIPFPLTRLFLPESSGNRTEKTETMNRIENRQAILWSRGNMQSTEHDDLDYSDRHSIGLWPCTVHWAVGAGGEGPRKWWLCTNQWAFQPLQKKAPCKTELQEPSNLRWQRLKWAIKCPWDSRQWSQISHFGLRRGDIAASIIFPYVPSLTEQLHIRTKRCQFDVPRWNRGKLMKPGPMLSFLKRLMANFSGTQLRSEHIHPWPLANNSHVAWEHLCSKYATARHPVWHSESLKLPTSQYVAYEGNLLFSSNSTPLLGIRFPPNSTQINWTRICVKSRIEMYRNKEITRKYWRIIQVSFSLSELKGLTLDVDELHQAGKTCETIRNFSGCLEHLGTIH